MPKSTTKVSFSKVHKLEKTEQRAVRAGKGFTLFISSEDMANIFKIVKSIGKTGILMDGATQTVKHEI